jgi:hypothetical protein
MRSRHFTIGPVGALLVLGACATPRTQLVPVVGSDLAPELIACVIAEAGPVAPGQPFVATASARVFYVHAAGDPEVDLPFSFGVVPPGADAAVGVEIRIAALDRCNDPTDPAARTVTRSVRTGFVRGARLALPMFLSSRCAGVTCEEGFTCEEGTCVPVPTIEPGTLRTVAGDGDELQDPGAPDASTGDASTTDAGCVVGAVCRPVPPQCGCSVGEGCYLPSGTPVCLPAGSAPDGADCAADNDCLAGSVCITGLVTGNQCGRLCDPAAPATCSTGVCIPSGLPGIGACMIGCDPVAQTGCGARGCYLLQNTGDTPFVTACGRLAGTGRDGAACTVTQECAAGFVCLDDGTASACRPLCDLATGRGCTAGTCNPGTSPLRAGATEYGGCL